LALDDIDYVSKETICLVTPMMQHREQQRVVFNYSTVVICQARSRLLPLDQADYGNKDKGVCDGVTACCPSPHRD